MGSRRAGGPPAPGRLYSANTPEAYTAFTVTDAPATSQTSLEKDLESFVGGWNSEPGPTLTVISSQKTTVDGRPALDARLSTNQGDVGVIRFISDDKHVVTAMTMGPEANEKTVNEMHQQLLNSIHIP
ncbi:hypothetical protein ACWGI8_35135 [Streptomyces sp. NPDC054841]